MYEQVLRKLMPKLIEIEIERGFDFKEVGRILTTIFKQFNEESKSCFVKLDECNFMAVKGEAETVDPPEIKDWDVPVLTCSED